MFTIPANPRKSMPTIFLNCTKNTELTPRPFARTFCFTSAQKMNRNPVGDKTRRQNVDPSAAADRQQRSPFTIERHRRKAALQHGGRAALQRRVNRPGLMLGFSPGGSEFPYRGIASAMPPYQSRLEALYPVNAP
jgi:hypothetical protein